MMPTRRSILGAAALLPFAGLLRAAEPDLAALSDMTRGVARIGAADHRARLARAQALMRRLGWRAMVIEPGASLTYFTGIRWWRSERLTAAVIPVEGEPLVVTPFFEAPSIRETLAVPADVRVWQEDEAPIALVTDWLRRHGLDRGTIGIEETARFFLADGLKALGDATFVRADAVVRTCRMMKTPAEIALMQAATDVTLAAYRWLHPRVEKGMTGGEIGALHQAATRALGGEPEFALALIGPAAALPHGSREVHRVADGQILLMDCGCTVGGYQSDVSRTWVPAGVPSAEQRKVWQDVHDGQALAFRTARIGTPAGAVDDAVRRHYAALGYGPGYTLPGLSHRTGHGIGMDGHEPVNLVHGETTPLAEGMCFSDEPGLYLPGRFGVRLEDCFHMTGAGPVWFSTPPRSIDAPIG